MKESLKQKAIREAWGDKYDRWKSEIDENGWLQIYAYNSFSCETYIDRVSMFNDCLEVWHRRHEYSGELISIRPIALKGVTRNNGWIRADEQLPKENRNPPYYGNYWIVQDGFIDILSFCRGKFRDGEGFGQEVTHWQPIEKPEKPIY